MYAKASKYQCAYKDIKSFFIDTTFLEKVAFRNNKVRIDRKCQ